MSFETKPHEIVAPAVEKVASLNELLPALKRGATAAVLESVPTPNFKWRLLMRTDKSLPKLHMLLGRFLLTPLPELHNILLADGRTDDECRQIEDMVAYVQMDIERTIKAFPGYKPMFIDVRTQTHVRVPKIFHRDVTVHNNQGLRICRVYAGPSTEFGISQTDTHPIIPSWQSISVHTGCAWHRVPRIPFFTTRVVAIVDLYPTE